MRETRNGTLDGGVPSGACSMFNPLLLGEDAGGAVGCASCSIVPALGGAGVAAIAAKTGHAPINAASSRPLARRSGQVCFMEGVFKGDRPNLPAIERPGARCSAVR